ncbi:hypothetical protein MJT46_019003 [Ovis ammon polii x Ovis aries]|nr:hypothetical protein MJT46_019003 [Ovis ammon polii x Ovis aries]
MRSRKVVSTLHQLEKAHVQQQRRGTAKQIPEFAFLKSHPMGNSQAVQWLGLRAFNAMAPDSIPGQGTKIRWPSLGAQPLEHHFTTCNAILLLQSSAGIYHAPCAARLLFQLILIPYNPYPIKLGPSVNSSSEVLVKRSLMTLSPMVCHFAQYVLCITCTRLCRIQSFA